MKTAPAEQRIGGYITTWTRMKMFPLDPREDEICIEDIAHSLSLQCRWGGHIDDPWSVASHSLEVMKVLSGMGREDLMLMGLLHDSSEAYLVDLPRPIKRAPGFGEGYIKAEVNLLRCIFSKFKVNNTGVIHPMVKLADDIALAQEINDFNVGDPRMNHMEFVEAPVMEKLKIVTPRQAEAQFLAAFGKLTR